MRPPAFRPSGVEVCRGVGGGGGWRRLDNVGVGRLPADCPLHVWSVLSPPSSASIAPKARPSCGSLGARPPPNAVSAPFAQRAMFCGAVASVDGGRKELSSGCGQKDQPGQTIHRPHITDYPTSGQLPPLQVTFVIYPMRSGTEPCWRSQAFLAACACVHLSRPMVDGFMGRDMLCLLLIPLFLRSRAGAAACAAVSTNGNVCCSRAWDRFK